jgi:hypothetical protein
MADMARVEFQQLDNYLRVVDPLVWLAQQMTRVAQQKIVPRPRRRDHTLRPGLSTPLWNAMATMVRTRLTRRGDKSNLARMLGVPPQRVHDYLRSRSRMPDAERTLLLLLWLAHRHEG